MIPVQNPNETEAHIVAEDTNPVPQSSAPDGTPAVAEPPGPGFFVHRHYLTDLSVESPFGRIPDEATQHLLMGYDARVSASPMEEEGTHQVDAMVQLQAAVGEQKVFLAELTYRMIVQLHQIATDDIPETLLVHVPTFMNPAMKSVFEHTGAFAGYPDMKVGQFDFAGAFQRQKDSLAAAAAEPVPPVTATYTLNPG